MNPFHKIGQRQCLLGLTVLAWLGAIATGFFFLTRHELEPGAVASIPSEWPASVPIVFDGNRMNLILFAHPRCPCTSATLTELIKVMTRCGDRVKVSILFFSPKEEEASWRQTVLWREASKIPGITVAADPDGKIATSFGALTSGQVLLFDPRGRLCFSGGITGSRGHEGDNVGADAVTSAILGKTDTLVRTPAYGCSLLGWSQIKLETP